MVKVSKSNTVMVVDDNPINLKLLSAILKTDGHDIVTYTNGIDLLEGVKAEYPDIILLDISMPDIDGFEVCTRLKKIKSLKDIPIIFISALDEPKNKVKAFDIGGVDYVTKPFNNNEILARVKTHLTIRNMQMDLKKQNSQLEDLILEKTNEIYSSQQATILALAKLTEGRDDDTGKHIERVQEYTKILAEKMLVSPVFSDQIDKHFIKNIFHATPLHDIGKVAIPDNILLKPGKLTSEEFEIIKTHTLIGAKTLEYVCSKYNKNTFLNMGCDIARSHHERWDGNGYPDSISGNQIPLAARIMSVADVYDALRMKRVYKSGLSHEETCEIILQSSGTQFDPYIIDIFKTVMDEFEILSEKLKD